MRIVLVSPFDAERGALHRLLMDDGHEVSSVSTVEDGVRLAEAAPPDAFIADAKIAGFDGLATVRALARCSLNARIVLLCPRVSRACAIEGAVCLPKPIDLGQLRRCLGDGRTFETRIA